MKRGAIQAVIGGLALAVIACTCSLGGIPGLGGITGEDTVGLNPNGDEVEQAEEGGVPGAGLVTTPTSASLGEIGDVLPTVTPLPEQKVRVRITVYLDEAGHVTFVDIPEDSEWSILRDGADITIVVEGRDYRVTCIELSGKIGDDGAFTAEGVGVVAGFQNVHGTLLGTILYDGEGLSDFFGRLTLGDMGELPQGKGITYDVERIE